MKKCYLLCDVPEKKIILQMINEGLINKGVETVLLEYDKISATNEECVAVLMTFSPEKGERLESVMPKAYKVGLLWEEDKGHFYDTVYRLPFSSFETVELIAELCNVE